MFEIFSTDNAKAYFALLAEARRMGFSEKKIALVRFCNYCRTDDKRYRIFQKCTFEQVRKAFDAFLKREYFGDFSACDFSDEELLGAFKQYYKPEYIEHLLGGKNGDNKSVRLTACAGQRGISNESQSRKMLQRDDLEQGRERNNFDEPTLSGD